MHITLEKPQRLLLWAEIYALYLKAFPAAERKPFSIIRRMHHQGKTDVWRILRDGKFVGLATTVNGDDLILLDYLAVCKSCRGQGVGSAAMKLLLETYRDKGLFVEIESTRTGAAAQQKRKQFYLNAGLSDMKTSAVVFGVPMELLGTGCSLNFDDYQNFYRDFYSPWAAEHLEAME